MWDRHCFCRKNRGVITIKTIETSKIKYTVKAVLQNGDILDITGLVTSLSWEYQKNALAAKADIRLANTKIKQGYITDLIKLCTPVYIFANDKEVFNGIVWDWSYTSAADKDINIVAYDKMIYLTQSKHNSYFSSGMSTQTIVESICNEWDIKVNYEWESWTHGKTVINNKVVSEHITSVLDEAQTKLNSKYVAFMNGDVLEIKKRGYNEDIFYFNTQNVVNVKDSLSIQKLVTKVIIVGKSEENSRPPLIKTVDGKTNYGILQEIITKDSNKTLDDAEKEAENILNENGKPEETISVNTIDVPEIKKGYKIKLVAGNRAGYFFVEGVSHYATDKTMSLELVRE